MNFCEKLFQTKLLSRLSHKVCRLLSSPVLLRSSLILGSLSSNVLGRRTSTGSELFSPLILLDTTNYVLLSVFTLIETTCPNVCSKSRLKSAKSPLPLDVCRSKTSLLKLPPQNSELLQTFVWWWVGGGGHKLAPTPPPPQTIVYVLTTPFQTWQHY